MKALWKTTKHLTSDRRSYPSKKKYRATFLTETFKGGGSSGGGGDVGAGEGGGGDWGDGGGGEGVVVVLRVAPKKLV